MFQIETSVVGPSDTQKLQRLNRVTRFFEVPGVDGFDNCPRHGCYKVVGFKLLVILLILPTGSRATQFDAISDGDMSVLTQEFAAVADHSSVGPASSMRKWGKELGLVGGRTDTPGLNTIALRSGSRSSIDRVPHASLFGALTFPHSLTGELTWLPYTPASGGSIQQWGIGLKWTISDEFLTKAPMDVAFKMKYSSMDVSFPETISNASTGGVPANVDVNFHDSVFGIALFLSQSHSSGICEIYEAIGYLQAFGDLGLSGGGSASIFVSQVQSVSASPYSWQGILGANFYPVSFLDLGLEFSRAFDRNSFNLKLSGQF